MRSRIATILVVLVLAAGGFFGYRYYQQNLANQEIPYQTAVIDRGRLTAQVGATGLVRPNQTTSIAWKTTGRIDAIYVEEGDSVTAGQILASLEERSLPQNVILARADLINAKKQLHELETSGVARAQAQLALTQAEKALEDAQRDRTSKNYARSSQAVLDAARADHVMAQDNFETVEENFERFANRAEDDPVRAQAMSQLAAARRQRDRALANLNFLLSRPDDLEIAEADAQLELAQANLEQAQREWARIQDGTDADEIEAARARIAAIEATLELARLDAPFDGVITTVSSKPGDSVSPGVTSFRLDDLSKLLVDVEVPEVDINRVARGQRAVLTFDAIQGHEYEGKVVNVARVGTPQQGLVNFIVAVELTSPDENVRPGMTSAVNLIIAELEDVL
ncbi:MAG TPA: efflux RND transporter periplasmic adaptor subunit, partial [Levilinea sp.]|nr:efflux RND transporter periplasmic adaptor subunit [Levilinea sp.]